MVLLLFPASCVPHLPPAGCVGWGEGVGPAEPSSTVCAVALFLPHKELRFIVYVFQSMWWLVWGLPTCEWGLSTLNTHNTCTYTCMCSNNYHTPSWSYIYEHDQNSGVQGMDKAKSIASKFHFGGCPSNMGSTCLVSHCHMA